MDFKERIFNLLEEQGKTAKALGKYIGVKESSISAWRNKDSYPSSKYILRISEFLGVSPTFLCTGHEDSNNTSLPQLTDGDREVLNLIKDLSEKDKYMIAGSLRIMIAQMPSQNIAPLFVRSTRTQEAFSDVTGKKK